MRYTQRTFDISRARGSYKLCAGLFSDCLLRLRYEVQILRNEDSEDDDPSPHGF
jgi:hypothetical protein